MGQDKFCTPVPIKIFLSKHFSRESWGKLCTYRDFSSPDKTNFKHFKMAPYLQKLYQHFKITLVLFSSHDKINFKSLPEMAFKIA